jgi:serine/threonine protein kinase
MRVEGKDELPSQFGRYTLVERLATGGMAEVFKAKISSAHGFEKLLVIKRILPNLAADRTFVSMFIDEAKLTAQLVHPKIVQVIDFGEVNGRLFIALEFVDGFDALALLRAAAQRQIRLPVPICMFVTMELLDALDYAHNAKDAEGKPMQLVHRDISPSNVFIARRGDVKLGDFGIAHAQERESKTQAGTLKGKYGYMSPEQVLGAPLDGRSDVFAVGVVLAEMLMSKRLFSAPNDLDVLLMVRDGRLDRWDKSSGDVPPALDEIVRKALARGISDRYQSAAEFRDALGDLLFQYGLRIGPSDLGRVAADYFDGSPAATARLKEQVDKWHVRTSTAAAGSGPKRPAAPLVEPPPPAPPPASRGPDEPTAALSASAIAPRSSAGASASAIRGAPPASRGPDEPTAALSASAIAPRPSASAARAAAPPMPTPTPSPRPADDPVDVVIDEDLLGSADLSGPGSSGGSHIAAALDSLFAQTSPLTVVELDQYSVPDAPAFPAGRDPSAGGGGAAPGLGAPVASPYGAGAEPQAGYGVPVLPRVPDAAADLGQVSPMRVFAELAILGETGLLRFSLAPHAKEVYLVGGAPESVNSSLRTERFGEYLVARGMLRPADLERALSQLPRFSGRLGEALVGLGIMKPLDVFRLLSQQVRERVIELFGWVQGRFEFYRGVKNPQQAFPLGLDAFEILGAGVLTMSYEFLERCFLPLLDRRPVAIRPARLNPDVFRLGPTPREVWTMLDGNRTLREWLGRFTSPQELVTFLRTLYLLIEAGLVQLA